MNPLCQYPPHLPNHRTLINLGLRVLSANKTASNTVANPITFSFAGTDEIILLEVMSALVCVL